MQIRAIDCNMAFFINLVRRFTNLMRVKVGNRFICVVNLLVVNGCEGYRGELCNWKMYLSVLLCFLNCIAGGFYYYNDVFIFFESRVGGNQSSMKNSILFCCSKNTFIS